MNVGKSGQNVETYHAFLGKQTHTQTAWQDIRPVSTFCGR